MTDNTDRMTVATHSESASTSTPGALEALSLNISTRGVFFALPVVFVWFGAMKFTAYEAEAVHGLIANSPLIGPLLGVVGLQGASYLIGVVEISIALLLALRFLNPGLAAIGAGGAAITFALTSTFFVTTPGVFLPEVGTLAISVVPGQFLLKDPILLLASLYALGDALKASRSANRGRV